RGNIEKASSTPCEASRARLAQYRESGVEDVRVESGIALRLPGVRDVVVEVAEREGVAVADEELRADAEIVREVELHPIRRDAIGKVEKATGGGEIRPQPGGGLVAEPEPDRREPGAVDRRPARLPGLGGRREIERQQSERNRVDR